MSPKHQHVLEAIFQEPTSGNIHWREIESLLSHLGAVILSSHGARMHFVLNGVEGVLHRPHHSNVCTKHEIRELRKYLGAAGISLSSYEG
ncbi:MAG: type II toxin-antitoxin system HicA family toxin [Gammaproteobacteria bacterium]